MVEPRILDDFKRGDWVGIHYNEPEGCLYDFPTIIGEISNRNPTELSDFVDVKMAPKGCPPRLKRTYISRIWRIGEVRT